MTSYRKFIILSSPRSGTHMLRSGLDAHARAVCLDEMFNPDYTKEYPFTEDTPEEEILNEFVFGRYPSATLAVGFCIHRHGARFGSWPRLWEMLQLQSDLHVISLTRENLLLRYLSFRLRNNQTLKSDPPEPMGFDPEDLVSDFRLQRAKDREFAERFAGHPMIDVTYEQLCRDYSESTRRIQEFLGVPYSHLEPRTTRRPTPRVSEIVVNYEELKDHFAQSEWAGFFDDDT